MNQEHQHKMSNELKHKLHQPGNCLSEQTMFDYIDHKLSAKEQHLVEKHLLDCDLCSDALEGLSSLKNRGRIETINQTIRQKLSSTERRVVYFNYKIAVSVAAGILLLAGGVFFFDQFTSKEMMSSDMAKLESKEAEAPPPPPAPPVEQPASEATVIQEESAGKDMIGLKKTLNDDYIAPLEKSESESTGDKITATGSTTTLTVNVLDQETVTDELKSENKLNYTYTPDDKSKLGFISSGATSPVVNTEQEKKTEKDLDKQLFENTKQNMSGGVGAAERDANENLRRESISKAVETKKSDSYYRAKTDEYKKGKKKEEAPAPASENFNLANNQTKPQKELDNKNLEDIPKTSTSDDRKDGAAKAEQMEIQAAFSTSDISVAKDQLEEDDSYSVVDEMPEYPGGGSALNHYIAKNFNYTSTTVDPETGLTSTKIYVQFIIDEQGKVSKARIIKGINPSLDKEALRIVNEMPAWKPGKLAGKIVKVKMHLPIKLEFK